MIREARRRKGERATGRRGRRSVSEYRCGRHGGIETVNGTYRTYGTNMTEVLWRFVEVFWRHKPPRPVAHSPFRRFGIFSWAELQATPVAGGEVFRRRTRTLTFID